MIIQPRFEERSDDHSFLGGAPTELRVGGAIFAVGCIVAALLAAYAALGTRLAGLPLLEPVAYLLLGISAVALLAIFLITFIRDQFRAGLYLVGCWLVTLFAIFVVFQVFG